MTAHAIPVAIPEYRDQRYLRQSARALRGAAKALTRGDVHDVLQGMADASFLLGVHSEGMTPSYHRLVKAMVALRFRAARELVAGLRRG